MSDIENGGISPYEWDPAFFLFVAAYISGFQQIALFSSLLNPNSL